MSLEDLAGKVWSPEDRVGHIRLGISSGIAHSHLPGDSEGLVMVAKISPAQ